ncbi:hypothetical protein EXIGLDRAFT_773522 [Exidia glandulosa HHB12029]|uniref:Uncharacterized protein n=1 Tax=Exidia glandulosa HHB12029 TaxID=1314781 RepID=A0A165ERG5_EXIGL|nr:hypothetical protein EXIGLDRAFT_773522 [Exidia glandulosa HHB12029]
MQRYLPLAIRCPGLTPRREPCQLVATWSKIDRGDGEHVAAKCLDHGIVAYILANGLVRLFPFVLSSIQKLGEKKGRHRPEEDKECVRCGNAAANKECDWWACGRCCAEHLHAACKYNLHYNRTMANGGAQLAGADVPLADVRFVPQVVRDVEGADVAVTVKVLLWWKNNVVGNGGEKRVSTTISVPRRDGNIVLASDFTDAALKDLKIRAIGLHRLQVLELGNRLAIDAFPSLGGSPFRIHGLSNVLNLHMELEGKEIGLCRPLSEEELYMERDWDTLGTVAVRVTSVVIDDDFDIVQTVICMVPRRRVSLQDVVVALEDLRTVDLQRLGLGDYDASGIDDGLQRSHKLDWSTPLNVQRLRDDDAAQFSLKLQVRAPGATPLNANGKRVRDVGVDGSASKRRAA